MSSSKPPRPRAAGIRISHTRNLPGDQVLEIYRANHWSSAKKPGPLLKALAASHSLVSAWTGDRLVGLANALSDGHLVVYYSHVIVHPDFQGQGVGTRMMTALLEMYRDFHQQVLIADGRSIDFYRGFGFTRAGRTEPMWIYQGEDH